MAVAAVNGDGERRIGVVNDADDEVGDGRECFLADVEVKVLSSPCEIEHEMRSLSHRAWSAQVSDDRIKRQGSAP